MVPLRTGRVFCAVAWAVSEGSHRLLTLLRNPLNFYSEDFEYYVLCNERYRIIVRAEQTSKVYSRLFTCIYTYAPIVHRCYASIAIREMKGLLKAKWIQHSFPDHGICNIASPL